MKSDNDTNVATENLITEARELCEKATEGPWNWISDDPEFLTLGTSGAEQEFHVLSSWKCKSCQESGLNCLWPEKQDAAFIARSRTLIPELCDALEKAQERGQGCEHCQGWDTRSGAQYCPMCGKKLPVYAGTIGGEIVQHALKELGAEEGAEHERD